MKLNVPLEIERKFIIQMPSKNLFHRGVTWHITQTYLTPEEEGENRRVRRSKCRGQVVYTLTKKRRYSDCASYEDEQLIDEASYWAHRTEARPDSETIEKVRHAVPYRGHILEIDVYPFWKDYAILEVELRDAEEAFELPPEIVVIREVTTDGRYKNTNIARHLHDHPGEPLPIE